MMSRIEWVNEPFEHNGDDKKEKYRIIHQKTWEYNSRSNWIRMFVKFRNSNCVLY